MPSLVSYSVHAGNIGIVYQGYSRENAQAVYSEYVAQSRDNYGRAAGEDVTMLEGGEPCAEYVGHCPHI